MRDSCIVSNHLVEIHEKSIPGRENSKNNSHEYGLSRHVPVTARRPGAWRCNKEGRVVGGKDKGFGGGQIK